MELLIAPRFLLLVMRKLLFHSEVKDNKDALLVLHNLARVPIELHLQTRNDVQFARVVLRIQ